LYLNVYAGAFSNPFKFTAKLDKLLSKDVIIPIKVVDPDKATPTYTAVLSLN
jgi:hypothetical protein